MDKDWARMQSALDPMAARSAASEQADLRNQHLDFRGRKKLAEREGLAMKNLQFMRGQSLDQHRRLEHPHSTWMQQHAKLEENKKPLRSKQRQRRKLTSRGNPYNVENLLSQAEESSGW